jgi:Tfp pilus assembly protein PilO
MNKLSKEKRTQLIITMLVTVVILAAIWSFLISSQKNTLKTLEDKKAGAQKKLSDMQFAIKNVGKLEAELAEAKKSLEVLEENMASGDLNSWMVGTIRQFKLRYNVEIPRFSPAAVADTSLFPKFPYKQVSVTISGTAHYHDIGRFVADLENRFPQIRIQNLSIESSGPTDMEKLGFQMDIVVLVKSGTT